MTTTKILAAIIANLTGTTGRTAADVALDLGITRQKAAAALGQLVADGKVWRHQVFADRGARYGLEPQADGPELPASSPTRIRTAVPGGWVSTAIFFATEIEVALVLPNAIVAELNFGAPCLVGTFTDRAAADFWHATLVQFANALALAAAVYVPTATSAKAAAVEAQVLRRAVDDADPLDPFEGRVSAPAGTPASAVPFVEEVAS